MLLFAFGVLLILYSLYKRGSMKKNILIIEDEKSISEAVSYALKSEGFSVQWEALGQEGIVHLKNNSVDLIVLDVGLPDISGFEVCKKLKSELATS